MNKLKLISLFTLFGFLLNNFHLYGQEGTSDSLKDLFLAFDKAVGEVNTGIYNGVEYIEKHRMINEKHKFFESDEFVPGKVYYDGQPFFNIPLKYNIFEDLLIVSPQKMNAQTGYSLFGNKLQAFELNGHRFVNIASPGVAVEGIYELLYSTGELQVLKKYKVKEKMIRKDAFVHYEFRSQKPKYLFFYQGEYRELSRRTLLEAFPGHRDLVIDKFRNFRKQSGERRDQAAVVLFQTLSQNNI